MADADLWPLITCTPGARGTLRRYGYVMWVCTIGPADNDDEHGESIAKMLRRPFGQPPERA